jgi:hypothetical protein
MSFWANLFKRFDKKERYYVSSADQLLQKFDAEHPRSESQLREAAKHKNIFYRNTQQPIKW